MKVQRLIELLKEMVKKNPNIEIGILIPEDALPELNIMKEEEGTLLYDISINEEEEEDFVTSGLVPIFLGKPLSDIPLVEVPLAEVIEKPSRVEITLGYARESGQAPSWRRMHIIPLSERIREFFPGYKIPFVLESDIGPLHTHIASAQRGIKGERNVGRYISRGLSKWFRKHSELKPGDIIVFDKLEENRYKMSIVSTERKLDLERQFILKEYIDNAIAKAIYEKTNDIFSCRIPSIEGIVAHGNTKEECKNNLSSIFQDWILSRIEKGLHLPVINKIDINNLIE